MTSEQYVIDNTEKIWDIIARHLSEDPCTHTIPEIVKECFGKKSGVIDSNTNSETPQISNFKGVTLY